MNARDVVKTWVKSEVNTIKTPRLALLKSTKALILLFANTMGIGIAIAAIAIAATVASDIGFSVEESKKQDQLQSAISQAQSAISNANYFYNNIYKIVKTRLKHLKQSMRKLPGNVVHKMNEQLTLNLNDPDKVMKDVGLALDITQGVVGLTALVTSGLTAAGFAAADGVVASISAVAGAAGAVLAVAGFGITLYNGIKELDKLDHAIDKVNKKRDQADDSLNEMKNSLDGLKRKLGLTEDSHQTLKDVSEDWSKLAKNFDKYSTSFCTAMQAFAMGKDESRVKGSLKVRGYAA